MKNLQTCSQCILDTNDDPDIAFNEDGICNHCLTYKQNLQKYYFGDDPELNKFHEILKKIKDNGKGKKYDVLIGISGGVDSTYVAYLCAKYKLNALAVHLDNGWNSEIAVANIKRIIKNTGFDLITHVINWKEFKDLQRSYFKAHVIDIEALTDHAIFTIMEKIAVKNNINYILSGSSITTEGRLPESWVHNKWDSINIKAIHNKFGEIKLETFPIRNYILGEIMHKINGLKTIDILNYIPYDKVSAKKLIQEKYNWKDYGGKHHESIFTRFYQSYILPNKFGVDKRKSHYSTLICAGQLNRDEAMLLIQKPMYPSTVDKNIDKDFVIKKLGFSYEEFETYLNTKEVKHLAYPSLMNYLKFLSKCKRLVLFWKY